MKYRLLIAVCIATVAAIFASSHPDGLDKVSQILGFAEHGVERTSLMTDYSISFLGDSVWSTIAAGLIGVLGTYGIFALSAMGIRRLRKISEVHK